MGAEVVLSGAVVGVVVAVPDVAVKTTRPTLTLPPTPTVKPPPVVRNLTKEVPDMLMGPQIRPAPAIGPKAGARPTARIRWSASGLPSSNLVLKIEKLACLV